MHVLVYGGEKFTRNKWRYVLSMFFLWLLFLATIFSGNLLGDSETFMPSWIDFVSGCILLWLAWWYRYYSERLTATIHQMWFDEVWLLVWDKKYLRSDLIGFWLEMKVENGNIYNFLLVTTKSIEIHTFASPQDEIVEYVQWLEQYIPYIENVQQRWFDKLLRTLKI